MTQGKKSVAIEKFIDDHVALNARCDERMNTGTEIVTDLLKNNEPFKDLFIDIVHQGSYCHDTAIKPVNDGDDFDLDLLLKLKQAEDWEPKDYLGNLHAFFYERERYHDIVDRRGKTRCVTLDYADDFHIDIVPSIEVGGQQYIANKKENEFEVTDGEGYAAWFAGRNKIAQGRLSKAVQLFKYLRNYKGTFTVKSIVLTTLFGMQVQDADRTEAYDDMTAALATLLTRLDAYLQARPTLPDVFNPALMSEKFTARHWTQEQYENFREMFHGYASRILDALKADDGDFESEMEDIFGSDFEMKKSLVETPRTGFAKFYNGYKSAKEAFIEDSISGVAENAIELVVDAEVKFNGWNKMLSLIVSPLEKQAALKFQVTVPRNIDMSRHQLYWKVKNGGPEAEKLGQLRGEIAPDTGSGCKKETTLYSGEHYVECYLVDTKSNLMVGKGRLDVLIV